MTITAPAPVSEKEASPEVEEAAPAVAPEQGSVTLSAAEKDSVVQVSAANEEPEKVEGSGAPGESRAWSTRGEVD